MNLLQLQPPIEVVSPLGDGLALLIIDYGFGWNSCWVVADKQTGVIKHFDSNDVRLAKNYTYKINEH